MAGVLVSRGYFSGSQLDWVFLLLYIIAGILTLSFLFLFNRLIALVASLFLRIYFWHHYRVHVNLQALQVSLLAGRIFFKKLHYSGRNETILVQDGHITWQYWLRTVEVSEVLGGHSIRNPQPLKSRYAGFSTLAPRSWTRRLDSGARMPCRIHLKLRGIQWFVYNRSPVYDAIVAQLSEPSSRHVNPRNFTHGAASDVQSNSSKPSDGIGSNLQQGGSSRGSVTSNCSGDGSHPELPANRVLPTALQLLPIYLDVSKAAMVMGNRSTTSILVAKTDKASGKITIKNANYLDLYKQVFEFDFQHLMVFFRPNRDFSPSSVLECGSSRPDCEIKGSHALSVGLGSSPVEHAPSRFDPGTRERSLKRWIRHLRSDSSPQKFTSLRNDDPNLTMESGATQWLGLSRYLDEEMLDSDHERWRAIDYAQSQAITDCRRMKMSLYWDVPGLVRSKHLNSQVAFPLRDDINGAPPPDWNIEVELYNGTITYGPWADRQRTSLQKVFFPSSYRDVMPAAPLPKGATRISTQLSIRFTARESITFRVPTRESSKDWKWKKSLGVTDPKSSRSQNKQQRKKKTSRDPPSGTEARPFGWFDIQISKGSSANMLVGLVPTVSGYQNSLTMELLGTLISSSVNHANLWKSQLLRISCELPSPREWQAKRDWRFVINEEDGRLFLLRDHIFLATDLINDWNSGLSPDYYTFLPTIYSFSLQCQNSKWYLNANDLNVIDNPINLSDNVFINIVTNSLSVDAQFSATEYLPEKNVVHFHGRAMDGNLELLAPSWSTLNSFQKHSSFGSFKAISITGSYDYFLSSIPSQTDVLNLKVLLSQSSLNLHGFLVKYVTNLKNNYFGEDMHFKTLEESQGRYEENEKFLMEHEKSVKNDIDVILDIRAETSTIICPSTLYTTEHFLRLDLSHIDFDLRITNYYMDIAISTSPGYLSCDSTKHRDSDFTTPLSPVQVRVDILSIHGHRLFGLPPAEPTYMCNWIIEVGEIVGECSFVFLQRLIMASKCFAYCVKDEENAWTSSSQNIFHDITFLRSTVQPIKIALTTAEAATWLETGCIYFQFDDLADDTVSERFHTIIPDLSIAMFVGAPRIFADGATSESVKCQASLNTTLDIHGITRKMDHVKERNKQRQHVRLHDSRSLRTPWLVPFAGSENLGESSKYTRTSKPAMPLPHIPSPVISDVTVGVIPCPLQSLGLLRSGNLPAHVQSTENWRTVLPSKQINQCDEMNHKSDCGQVARNLFSSPYRRPHYPLLTLLRTKAIFPTFTTSPESTFDKSIYSPSPAYDCLSISSPQSDGTNELCIDMSTGIRAHATDESISLIDPILQEWNDLTDEQILDEFQIRTIQKDLAWADRAKIRSKTLNLQIRSQFLGLKLSASTTGLPSMADESYNDIELLMRDPAFLGRWISFESARSNRPHDLNFTMYLRSQSVEVLAQGAKPVHLSQSIILEMCVRHIALTLAHGDELDLRLHTGAVDGKLRSETVLRAFQVINAIAETGRAGDKSISMHQAEQLNRLQMLLLSSAKHSDQVAEPAFLSSASHLLRTRENHIRSSPSWRAISRLRHIQVSEMHHVQCEKDPLESDSQSLLSSIQCYILPFAQSHQTEVGLFHPYLWSLNAFGPEAIEGVDEQLRWRPTKVMLDMNSLAFLLTSKEISNTLSLQEPILAISIPGCRRSDKTFLAVARTWIISIQCCLINLSADWSLCGTMFNIIQAQAMMSSSRASPNLSASGSKPLGPNYQVIFSCRSGKCVLDTPNAQIVASMSGLQISILTEFLRTQRSKSQSLVLDLKKLRVDIGTKTSCLGQFSLNKAQVLGFSSPAIQSESMSDSQYLISSDSTSIMAVKALSELAALAEEVIANELYQLQNLIQSAFRKEDSPNLTSPLSPSGTNILLPNVALCLDEYLISLLLMSSLTYEVAGTNFQSIILYSRRGVLVDFDLQEHSHLLKSATLSGLGEFPSFSIPPINGSILVDESRNNRVVKFKYLAEQMNLSATSLRAVLDALSRPIILEMGKDLNLRFARIRHKAGQVKPIKGSSRGAMDLESNKPLLYYFAAMVSGIAIHASTSEVPNVAPAVELDLDLGRLRLQGTNLRRNCLRRLSSSVMNAQLCKISLNLLKSDDLDFQTCGSLETDMLLQLTSGKRGPQYPSRVLALSSQRLHTEMHSDMPVAVVSVIGHLQSTLMAIDMPTQVKTLQRKGRERLQREGILPSFRPDFKEPPGLDNSTLRNVTYKLQVEDVRTVWRVPSVDALSGSISSQVLGLTIAQISLSTAQTNFAQLLMKRLRIQMGSVTTPEDMLSSNSAMLPEVAFSVVHHSTAHERRFAFQATGKSLDLRLTTQFALPANELKKSIERAHKQVRVALTHWKTTRSQVNATQAGILGEKRISLLLLDADFAGATIRVRGDGTTISEGMLASLRSNDPDADDSPLPRLLAEGHGASAVLQAPGIATKILFDATSEQERSLNAEIKISSASNSLSPQIVPLIVEISSYVKLIMQGSEVARTAGVHHETSFPQRLLDDERLRHADPNGLLWGLRVNVGLRICKQIFDLSCQPAAKVIVEAGFEDVYIAINTIHSTKYEKFFTFTAKFRELQASIQHAYSREVTGKVGVDEIEISFMNSKHINDENGLSAILTISPIRVQINAKQLHEFLIFRDIWMPPDTRVGDRGAHSFTVQRYQQIAIVGAFPWTATISVAELVLQLDLGQSLGKMDFSMSNAWLSSQKSSDLEQTLSTEFDIISIGSEGRLGGSLNLRDFRARTSIQWPSTRDRDLSTPLVEASARFNSLQLKAGFDYQPFIVCQVNVLEFLMYNVRQIGELNRDRLVGTLDGSDFLMFCTSSGASQFLGIFQSFQRLSEERQKAYELAVGDLQRSHHPNRISKEQVVTTNLGETSKGVAEIRRGTFSVHTRVNVSLKSVCLGAFPGSFLDSQVFKAEASEIATQFAVNNNMQKVQSTLSMTLDQLRISLSGLHRASLARDLEEISATTVIGSAVAAKGGTILRVPELVARMQTRQDAGSLQIHYTFTSTFHGKVDVGWNYSRISYIRGMYANHARTLAHRLGRDLQQAAVQITGLGTDLSERDNLGASRSQEKITAVVTVPQSKYTYIAVRPSIIETPQLRDMGEATPPLEWIGLQRDRLPHVTHQIIIVPLLEFAREVDEAYARILGSSFLPVSL